ncbi:hypothetical protein QTG56_24115 (plasmid) [Rossellomorea sp. AcN35-11]|nr:hypothetical protein [Rossellomorea aquimaris]WJV31725.1 hypothetical protein QTG56_24115 [Rossellomorea sp. AcN35-11]
MKSEIEFHKKTDTMLYSKNVYIEEVEKVSYELNIPRHIVDEWKSIVNEAYTAADIFPLYLEKVNKEFLINEVIYYYPPEELLIYEYRKYSFPNGELHAIKAKRNVVNKADISDYLSDGFEWTTKLKIPMLLDYSKIKNTILEEDYEDLKS